MDKADMRVDATVDDAMLDQWAEQYERGEFSGVAGEAVVRSQFGRPRLFDEPMVPKTVRLRPDQGAQLAAFAKADAKNPSALVREAWDQYAANRLREAA